MDSPKNSHPLTYTEWTITETQFVPEQLQTRETVFTIGNGYLGTRGSFEEGYPRSVPATLIHGVYDAVPVMYTELVNCPDWLPLTISLHSSSALPERFRLDQGEVLHYERRLDLRWGILSRFVRWRSRSGKTLEIQLERFTSLADRHVLAIRCSITPVDFDGTIEVQASLNGYAENQGFNHWELLDQGQINQEIWLQARTRSSRIELGTAAKVTLNVEAQFESPSAPGYPTLSASAAAVTGQNIVFEKIITVFTSQDADAPLQVAQAKLAELPPYNELLNQHQQAWDSLWQHSDVVIEGDRTAQLAVRYNLFQLLISAPRHTDRVSIPAKTLSGFGYRGHIFWDTEIFILPFFTFTQPEIAQNLLTYRHHTLPGARRKAKYYGYQGAMFAWESADTGDEVTPRWALPSDPYGSEIRIWCRDREIHISADVTYAAWQYWQANKNDDWMRDYGAEIILDTAVFWTSRVEWNEQHQRYEIREVIGADEYHESVNNNAFTNRMAQWHLEKALAVYDWLQHTFPKRAADLEYKLDLTSEQRARWQDIANQLWIPYDPATGLIEQYEGFFNLEDIDLSEYEPRTQSMQAILGIEGTNKRQVLKQPDVLMLLYLMRQVQTPYSRDILRKNWDYYAPRTDITYGSSLGPAIHAILAADLDDSAEAYERFMQAALVDLEDTRGNAAEGVHGASAGGIWQAVVFGFGGIQFQGDQPIATPHLPANWTGLKFQIHWHGQWHQFDLKADAAVAESKEQQTEGGAMTEQDNAKTMRSVNVQGVIFDLDGVLTDTAEYHYRAWQRLADEEGLPFDRQANEALRGVSRRESLLKIVGNRSYPEAELQAMMDRKNRYYVESIELITAAELLPGAMSFLDELRRTGIKTAIASASKNAHTVIEKLGIADKVDVIADGYSVERPKPAPDLFLYAANQLGLSPAESVVFEDAAAGIEAALAAGMWAVGLGPTERVGAADVVLPNLSGLTWNDLLAKLSNHKTR